MALGQDNKRQPEQKPDVRREKARWFAPTLKEWTLTAVTGAGGGTKVDGSGSPGPS